MLRGLQPQTMTSHPCLVAPLKMENSRKGSEARVKVKNQFIVPSSSFLLFTVKMDVALCSLLNHSRSQRLRHSSLQLFPNNLVFFEKINILFRKAINPVSYDGKKMSPNVSQPSTESECKAAHIVIFHFSS